MGKAIVNGSIRGELWMDPVRKRMDELHLATLVRYGNYL